MPVTVSHAQKADAVLRDVVRLFTQAQRVMIACCSVMFASTLVLLNLSAVTAFAFLVLFGFGYGGTFVLLQRIAADYFGNRDYPKILGVLIVIETLGAVTGGMVTGWMADAAGGDYSAAFYAMIAVSGLAFVLTIVLGAISGDGRRPGVPEPEPAGASVR